MGRRILDRPNVESDTDTTVSEDTDSTVGLDDYIMMILADVD